jgi:outer membrane protein assembly factor BamA
MRFYLLLFLPIISYSNIFAQSADSLLQKKPVKKGFSFGAVPAVGFDSDIGIKYGSLVNLYWYGNGSQYPQYRHAVMSEWSQTTKGSGLKQLIYDSQYLIPGIRLTAEATYSTEQAFDFYGFNGYKAWYNPDFENKSSTDYKSRVYYRIGRNLLRFRIDFQGKFSHSSFGWLAGWIYESFNIDSVNVDKLNKGLSSSEKLPYVGGGLYGKYLEWGFISETERKGGDHHLLRIGFNYDTRDNEPNPMKGIWTDLVLLVSPSFIGSATGFSRIIFTHRQYLSLVPGRLSLSGRLAYQGTLTGKVPWYMLSMTQRFGPDYNRDGLGGAKTLRGVLRARVIGEDVTYSNIELRWKFLKTAVFNQNLHLSMAPFADFGFITKPYKLPATTNPDALTYLAKGSTDGLHSTVGTSIFAALNENFVVGMQYGRALDNRDGNQGFYIVMSFMY